MDQKTIAKLKIRLYYYFRQQRALTLYYNQIYKIN
jgi:hypothetical protein